MNERPKSDSTKSILREGPVVYESREALEEARLRGAVNRTDTENSGCHQDDEDKHNAQKS